MKDEKVRFRDLSGWLKLFVVVGWIYIIATILKNDPYFFSDILENPLFWWIIGLIIIIKLGSWVWENRDNLKKNWFK